MGLLATFILILGRLKKNHLSCLASRNHDRAGRRNNRGRDAKTLAGSSFTFMFWTFLPLSCFQSAWSSHSHLSTCKSIPSFNTRTKQAGENPTVNIGFPLIRVFRHPQGVGRNLSPRSPAHTCIRHVLCHSSQKDGSGCLAGWRRKHN